MIIVSLQFAIDGGWLHRSEVIFAISVFGGLICTRRRRKRETARAHRRKIFGGQQVSLSLTLLPPCPNGSEQQVQFRLIDLMTAENPPIATTVYVIGRARSRGRGFTIVELMTGIAAVAILLALVIHAATAVRTASERASEMASARSLGIAWAGYATDHRGAVLPGYASGFEAVDANGDSIATQTVPIAARRWPLRLAPYLGHNLATLYSGPNRDYATEIDTLPDDESLYAVSAFPSFGMNSVFVGGDENFGGYSNIFLETFGRFYVDRLSSVQRPDRLIVFATSRTNESTPGSTGPIREGFFRVLPPGWTLPLWADEYDPADPASAGFVSPRHRQGESEEVALVTTVDGGVSTSTIDELRDLRRWSNAAKAADWVMAPIGP